MPRGSKPGERRGGRRRGTPNKATVAKAAALRAASADPATTPLQFLLGLMRDEQAPTDLRVRVARIAAPLVHGKGALKSEPSKEGFAFDVDPADAKSLRDIEHRLATFLRKRYGPSENGGPLTAPDADEEAKLLARRAEIVSRLICPPDYGSTEVRCDSDRLHQLNCKRLSSRSDGRLDANDDDEEALLTARIASFWHSRTGEDLKRMQKLQLQEIAHHLTEEERQELNQLSAKYSPRTTSNVSQFMPKLGLARNYRST